MASSGFTPGLRLNRRLLEPPPEDTPWRLVRVVVGCLQAEESSLLQLKTLLPYPHDSGETLGLGRCVRRSEILFAAAWMRSKEILSESFLYVPLCELDTVVRRFIL